MHSVTSGAVASALGSTSCFLIPICLEHQETSSTEYVRYKKIGAGFDSYFNDVLPNVSGKTKKVKFLISYGTQELNQNVLDRYTDIVFKSDMSNYVAIIDYVFAYVY